MKVFKPERLLITQEEHEALAQTLYLARSVQAVAETELKDIADDLAQYLEDFMEFVESK